MPGYLQADWETAAAHCAATISPASSDLYIQFQIRFPGDTLADHVAYTSLTGFLWLWDSGGWDTGGGNGTQSMNLYYDAGSWKFGAAEFPFFGGPVVADTWYQVDLRQRKSGGTSYTTIKINGVDSGEGEIDYTDNSYTVGEVTFGAAYTLDPLPGDSFFDIDNIKIGTSAFGSTEIADIDFETGTLASLFDFVEGDVTLIGAGGFTDTSEGRVCIAFDDTPLEPDPVWTRIDDNDSLVAEIVIHRGRQSENEQTDTSTATVRLNDTEGLFDPNNGSSPYFNKLDGKQIRLMLWNPVTEEWVSQYRGFIDNITTDFAPSQVVATVQIDCVDLFDYLAGVEMIPGLFGDASPVGTVVYEDTDVQTRIEQLLTNAGVPSDMAVVFSGNVDVRETKYDPGDSILVALRDACDAEFPGIANMYTDKLGRFVFHGRKARFDPDTVALDGDWTFTRWKAGDGAEIALDADRAQIRPPLRWARPRSRIVNAAICYPRPSTGPPAVLVFREEDMVDQIVIDTDSRDDYGYHSWSAPDLITQEGTTTGLSAKDECKLFAEWKVANYKDPRTIVEALTFRSLRPTDPRAEKTWALICGQDISDIVDLAHGYPGGTGIFEELYIEGSEMTIRPGPPEFDFVELTLNVSPQSYYTDDVFVT